MAQSLSRWLDVDDTLGWGTTAESRRRQAPDPEAVQLDGRGDADLIRFVQAFSQLLRWVEPADAGAADDRLAQRPTWEAFCAHPSLTPEAMAAFWTTANGPAVFSQAERHWLGRPHFALLLVFIRLLRHQRQLLNALPARHLAHYYRDRLGFTPRPGEPDRVTVAFTLAEGAPPLLLPAGSVMQAGEDERGRQRRYRTLTDLAINHARVRRLRALQLDRGVTTLGSIQAQETLPGQRLDRMLRLVYGAEAGKRGRASEELRALLPRLRFCAIDGNRAHLHLEPREFMRMMRLVRQRTDAGAVQEWAAINRWLGVEDLLNNDELRQRDFNRNLAASLLGPEVDAVDWKVYGLSEVDSVDDLYACREQEAVKTVLRSLLTATTCRLRHDLPADRQGDAEALFAARLASFEQLMAMKLHIDAQWQQVNWLLERCGKRRRQLPTWQLDAGKPNSRSAAFKDNLATAWGSDPDPIPWPEPIAWIERLGAATAAPSGVPDACWRYFQELELLEEHYGLHLEELLRLGELAALVEQGTARVGSWAGIQELLTAAHRERWLMQRRAPLERARQGRESAEAFSQLLRLALQGMEGEGVPAPDSGAAAAAPSLSDQDCLNKLSPWLPPGTRQALERFGALLKVPGTAPRRLGWPEVVALLEGAQRAATGERPPELAQQEWRQLFGREQEISAEELAAGKLLAPSFWTGRDGAGNAPAPEAGPGFVVASQLLALAEGSRRIELSLGFTAASGTPEALLASLPKEDGATISRSGCAGAPPAGEQPGWGLNQALLAEVSTAEGWRTLPIAEAVLWPQRSRAPGPWELRLVVQLGPADPPLAPLAAGELPRLRLRLRPWREGTSSERHWRGCGGFDRLRIAAARLQVEVSGLQGVRLQRDGTTLDPGEPFNPFGSIPEVGSCLYISHPELLRGGLQEIRFAGTWKNLPASLATHYQAYRGWPGLSPEDAVTAGSFRMDVSLRVRDASAVVEEKGLRLFAESGRAGPTNGLSIRCQFAPPLPLATAATAPESAEDLRRQARVWCWLLAPLDFGHGLFPALAARRARELAVAISASAGRQALALAEAMDGDKGSLGQRYDDALKAAGAAAINPADYAVPEPYTPLLEGLEVGYTGFQELGAAAAAAGQVLRVHGFGEEEPLTLPWPRRAPAAAAKEEAPLLLPGYSHPGELWFELEGVRPGLPLALALQLAAGSARGARPTPAVLWEVRQGWRWRPLPVSDDGTDGLLQSGIMRFTLPEEMVVEETERLWIRACLPAPVEAYATLLAVQTQAVEAEAIPPEELDDEEPADAAASAPAPAPQPLAPQSVTALEEPVPGIAAIHQPFSSRSGRPAETEAELRGRAAERLRHKGRALAGWDYERLLWEAFGSQMHAVMCQPAREGEPVTVVVIPNLRDQVPRNLYAPGAPADLLTAMERHLRQRCPAETEVVVRNATYVHVMAQLWVCLKQGADPAHAERELRQAVLRVLSPWCFDADAEVRPGGEVRAGDLAVAIDALPEVAYLERIRLFLVDARGRPLRIEGQSGMSEERLRAPAADVVLIASPWQLIEVVSATTTLPSLLGIGGMRIELDFQVS
jgi:hypothetical protein